MGRLPPHRPRRRPSVAPLQLAELCACSRRRALRPLFARSLTCCLICVNRAHWSGGASRTDHLGPLWSRHAVLFRPSVPRPLHLTSLDGCVKASPRRAEYPRELDTLAGDVPDTRIASCVWRPAAAKPIVRRTLSTPQRDSPGTACPKQPNIDASSSNGATGCSNPGNRNSSRRSHNPSWCQRPGAPSGRRRSRERIEARWLCVSAPQVMVKSPVAGGANEGLGRPLPLHQQNGRLDLGTHSVRARTMRGKDTLPIWPTTGVFGVTDRPMSASGVRPSTSCCRCARDRPLSCRKRAGVRADRLATTST